MKCSILFQGHSAFCKNIAENICTNNETIFSTWEDEPIENLNFIKKHFSKIVINKKPYVEVIKETLKKRLKEGQFNLRHDVDLPVFYVKNPNIPKTITKEKYPIFFLEDIENL